MTRVYRRPLPRALAHPAKDKVTVAAGAVVALVLLLALLAPLLTPYEPNAQDPVRSYEGPSWSHPFGTDQFGRDILTRLLFGARLSLTIGLGSVGVALAIGATLGVLSGFYRSVLDVIIMRAVDVALAFPLIIFSTLIVVVLGPSLVTVIFGVGVSLVPLFARLARSMVLSVREQEFFEAAISLGCSDLRLMRHHLLPHVLPLLFVQATTAIGLAILSGAALSFIGIGVQPPTADWGRMVSEFAPLVFVNPLLSLYPGLAIAITALACNLLGDGLLRAVDPTAKRAVL
ncbi:MAG TPA: ABC transporter permease [Gaiellaceae bacterium]|nr:ABC transporter permease [Gaiellaceae bacterium]